MKFSVLAIAATVSTLSAGLINEIKKVEEIPLQDKPEVTVVDDKATIISQNKSLSEAEIRNIAKQITVQIIVGKVSGSGILLQKQGNIYTVLTNEHVLRLGSNYQIKTVDGKLHTGRVVANNFGDDDLGLLQFNSNNSYEIAQITTSQPVKIGDETFAGGFPANRQDADSSGFTFTQGKIGYLLAKSFLGGYQLGYSNDIFKGMSGGPVLNRQGKLIGVNGKHKFPLWGNVYVFKDGSTPDAQIRDEMDYYSWAIPIQTVVSQISQLRNVAIVPFSSQPIEANSRYSRQFTQENQPYNSLPKNFNPPEKNNPSSDFGQPNAPNLRQRQLESFSNPKENQYNKPLHQTKSDWFGSSDNNNYVTPDRSPYRPNSKYNSQFCLNSGQRCDLTPIKPNYRPPQSAW